MSKPFHTYQLKIRSKEELDVYYRFVALANGRGETFKGALLDLMKAAVIRGARSNRIKKDKERK